MSICKFYDFNNNERFSVTCFHFLLFNIIMGTRKIISVCGIFLVAFLMTSCSWDYEPVHYDSFDYDLRGTWVSNDPSVYYGELEIDFNRITIVGYNESQTPSGEDDGMRPFRAFTKGTALKGYSENGVIFIEDAGFLNEGIPYTYYTAGNYPYDEFIRLSFGDRVETLQKLR